MNRSSRSEEEVLPGILPGEYHPEHERNAEDVSIDESYR